MGMTASEIRRYLIREQGWDEDVVNGLDKEELLDAWDNYHE